MRFNDEILKARIDGKKYVRKSLKNRIKLLKIINTLVIVACFVLLTVSSLVLAYNRYTMQSSTIQMIALLISILLLVLLIVPIIIRAEVRATRYRIDRIKADINKLMRRLEEA